MMFFEGLLRLILYLGPQRAVEHEYEEGKFQQEPIISLMVEPCYFYPIWKTGTDKKYQILKIESAIWAILDHSFTQTNRLL